MIRIVCPFCHAPLGVNELELAISDGHTCLVCPACDKLLVTEDAPVQAARAGQHEVVVEA